jgi:crotonobetainyl-CoA:carnitine CoA-transferase CaiB-like acyl-CoA transferase
VFVAARDDRAFARLCAALDRSQLADDARFATGDARASHDAELAGELAAVFASRPADAWERDLTAAGVACVQAHDGLHASYIFDAPWAEELGFVEQAAAIGFGPYPRYGRVVRTERDLGLLGPADRVGAQTRAILAELGYADEQVDAMVARGIVGTPADPA